MLHWLMGDDAFRIALRDYYADNHLQHVTESDFRAAVNAASADDLDWFFEQWIHTTGTLDYSIGELSARQADDGRRIAQVEVVRDGENWMPVDLRVGDTVQRLTSRDRRQTVTIAVSGPPTVAVIDPDNVLLDVNPANNTREFPR
jgi:aminopeptidase N